MSASYRFTESKVKAKQCMRINYAFGGHFPVITAISKINFFCLVTTLLYNDLFLQKIIYL